MCWLWSIIRAGCKRTRKTNIGIHVIYDDDIKAKQRNQRTASVTLGPKHN
jgi:hypothetical protein